jgi:lipoprotein-anchoring transpeptidase ErfK/SrfK
VAALALALASTAACVGERPTLATDTQTSESTVEDTTTTTAEDPTARVAQAKADAIDLYDDATATTPRGQLTNEQATAVADIPIVFLVEGERGDRLQVHLPNPPVGGTAWVRKADVTLSSVKLHIEVSLGEHRIRVFDGAQQVLDERAAIGTEDHPDPGTYYLKELLQSPDTDGPYGTYAYGLSGFATSLAGFDRGEGVVGIHGTDDPSSIGKDVSTGSIGLADEVIARLVDDIGLPLGTPVEILR